MEEEVKIKKIFVAEAKKLKSKRNFVKRIMSEYNTNQFDLYMKPVDFYVYDYTSFNSAERPNGKQEELYNTFIDSNVDIALFLVNGAMGNKTEKELKVAINAKNKDRRPSRYSCSIARCC